MIQVAILDLCGNTIASKRFDDDNDPSTPNQWQDKYFFYHYDIRGSVTAIVKPDGTSEERYTYDEFGNLSKTGTSSFKNEVTFTGSVTDTSTGLQYMNARYYEPKTGRFITQDSYTGNPYDPWTQHLYSYAGNNPTNFVDPTGHKYVYVFGTWVDDKNGSKQRKHMTHKQLVDNKDAWWDTVPESSTTIPSTDEVISNVGAAIAGGSLDVGEKTASSIKVKKNWVIDRDGYVVNIPGSGVAVPKFPKVGKVIGKAATVVTIATTGLDVANTWTENNGNTNGQRVEKTAIQVGGTALSVAAGIGIFAAVNAWNPVGWVAGAVAGVVALGALIGSSLAINYAQEKAYEALDIK